MYLGVHLDLKVEQKNLKIWNSSLPGLCLDLLSQLSSVSLSLSESSGSFNACSWLFSSLTGSESDKTSEVGLVSLGDAFGGSSKLMK